MKPLPVQFVPVTPCLLPAAPWEERPSVLFVALHGPVRFDRGSCNRYLVLSALAEPAAAGTAEGFSTCLFSILFNAICPGTAFSCTMKWLYFVIRSISTPEYQFTAQRYRVSSKSEKRKGRSYITGLASHRQDCVAGIPACRNTPPPLPSAPEVLTPQPPRRLAHLILQPETALNDRAARHPMLKGNREGWSPGIFEPWGGQLPGCLPACFFLQACAVSLHKTADPSVNHIE